MASREEIDCLTNQLRAVLLNKPISKELIVKSEDLQELQGAVEYISTCISELQEFLGAMCEGRLNVPAPGRHNFTASNLKELHSILRHLTWQTSQVASGDYSQRVRFLGEFSDSFNILTAQLREREESITAKTAALKKSINLLKIVLDAQQDWVVVADAQDHKVIYLNACAKRDFFNPETGEFFGKNCEILMDKILSDTGSDNSDDNTVVYPVENTFYSIRSFPMEWENKKAFVYCIGDVTDAQEEKEQLEDMAFKDTLTVAYNRRYCVRKLKAYLKHKKPSAVVLIDLDGLKQVNDVLGHLQGDDYLTTVANCAVATLRARDKLCRVGGDEFVVIMPDCSLVNAHKKLEYICQKLSEEKRPFKMQISYGIVHIGTETKDNLEELLHAADEKMYEMKQSHKNEE